MRETAKERGVALFMVVLIMSVILAIALGISGILIQQIRMSGNIEDSVISFYAADSGIEQQIYDLYKLKDSHQDHYDLTLENDAFYNVAVECSTPTIRCAEGEEFYGLPVAEDPLDCLGLNFCIRSLGTFHTAKRAIEVKY